MKFVLIRNLELNIARANFNRRPESRIDFSSVLRAYYVRGTKDEVQIYEAEETEKGEAASENEYNNEIWSRCERRRHRASLGTKIEWRHRLTVFAPLWNWGLGYWSTFLVTFDLPNNLTFSKVSGTFFGTVTIRFIPTHVYNVFSSFDHEILWIIEKLFFPTITVFQILLLLMNQRKFWFALFFYFLGPSNIFQMSSDNFFQKIRSFFKNTFYSLKILFVDSFFIILPVSYFLSLVPG